MPFDRTDLLDQAGYSSGDVIPLNSWNNLNARDVSVTSTSFVTATNLLQGAYVNPNDTPSGDYVFRLEVFTINGSPNGMECQLFNETDGEEIVTVSPPTSPTNSLDVSPWTSYTPTTTPFDMAYRHRSETGNAVRTVTINARIGVEL